MPSDGTVGNFRTRSALSPEMPSVGGGAKAFSRPSVKSSAGLSALLVLRRFRAGARHEMQNGGPGDGMPRPSVAIACEAMEE